MSGISSASVTRIRIPDPKLDIRNSKGMILTEPNQMLYDASVGPDSDNYDNQDEGEIRGSFRPASGPLSQVKAITLNVDVNVDVQGTTMLEEVWSLGAIDGVTKRTLVEWTEVPMSALPQGQASNISTTLTVQFNAPDYFAANFPWGYAGDVIWQVKNGTTVITANSTRLELYCLTDTLPVFYHGSVDVGFLRRMVLFARPKTADQSWTDYVVRSAFSSFGYKYEIAHGAFAFAGGDTWGSYDLKRWCRNVNRGNLVNCYDQAGIVMIALGLGPPAKVEWMYMKPFGFIRPIHLVGYPNTMCDSPLGGTEDKLKVGKDTTGRTPFGNHAFVRVNDRIADACAGPITAQDEDTLEHYVENTIQGKTPPGTEDPTEATTKLYYSQKDPDYQEPGTVDDAHPHLGVTALDACDIRDAKHPKKKTPNSDAAMIKARGPTNNDVDTTVYMLEADALDATVQSAAPGQKVFCDVSVNALGLELVWDVWATGQPDTTITLYICTDHALATGMFENDLHLNSVPMQTLLQKPTDQNVYGDVCEQVSLTSLDDSAAGLVMWVRGNTMLRIKGPATAASLFQQYGAPLDRQIKGSVSTPPPGPLAALSAGNNPAVVQRDENFQLEIKCPFVSSRFSYVDLNIDSNNKAVYSDLIVLRHVVNDKASGNYIFNMGAGTTAQKHTLQFAFAELATSRVRFIAVNIEVQ